jgi:hypothetical protein
LWFSSALAKAMYEDMLRFFLTFSCIIFISFYVLIVPDRINTI